MGAIEAPKNLATIHHLALYRAGLVVSGTDLAGGSSQAFLDNLRVAPPESIPGEKFRYTNVGFRGMLAGKALSRVGLKMMFHPWPEEGYAWHARQDASGRRLIERAAGCRSTLPTSCTIPIKL